MHLWWPPRGAYDDRVPRLAFALAIVVTSGCVTVAPYERGRLAKPDMELEHPADLVAGSDHAHEFREGSVGGWGSGGGGCGCN